MTDRNLLQRGLRLFGVICLLTICAASQAADGPLALHPENPHYFLFRGRPTILVTSGEHYGAVLNQDFDFVKYLATLHADGLNLTRTFSGAYVEPVGAFKIDKNTLAPAPRRFLAPWVRSDTPGCANGGNKFDLSRFSSDYFQRLRAFVTAAAERGVVVEMNLFCPFYDDKAWSYSPMNAVNNVNGLGTVPRTDVYTLERHGGLLAVQQALVRRIVQELATFDNVYYEICNEPYFAGVELAWQHHVADVIREAEQGLPRPHLISQNVANRSAKIENPHPGVSIFNFHYAVPPDAVRDNFHLNKVIGDNETGFAGTDDARYRMEAWDFLIAGGGLFNHLDYSFTVGHEDGTFRFPSSQPGGGGPTLRRQLGFLRQFLEGFDFLRMRPDPSVIVSPPNAEVAARALSQPGAAYAIYLRPIELGQLARQGLVLPLKLPAGIYQATWHDPRSGETLRDESLRSTAEVVQLSVPPLSEDLALRVTLASGSVGSQASPR